MKRGLFVVSLPLSLAAVLAAPILAVSRAVEGFSVFILAALGLAGVLLSTRGLLKSWV